MRRNKGSYRQKYLDRQPADSAERTADPAYSFRVSPEQRTVFEAGQTLLIDKPLHWTSFDVVRKIRYVVGIRKVGHAGTLDPLATGLLIVCTGQHTRRINELMAATKEYTGTITLGAVTPTYDLESAPEPVSDPRQLPIVQVEAAVAGFIGPGEQRPPVYSAIKKKGTPLYELARRGEEVELTPRPIHIHAFDILSFDGTVLSFRIVCSTGTYIRSIAHDLGQMLGCGGYLSALRRTAIGTLRVEQALTPDEWVWLQISAGGQNE